MKMSRRDLMGVGVASMAAAIHRESEGAELESVRAEAGPASDENLTIRGYLCREASRITASALRDYRDAESFRRLQPEKRRQFHEMMGLTEQFSGQRPPVPVHVTGVVERPGYRIEKLSYESLPNLHVTANLYIPQHPVPNTRHPAVLYVCGHAPNQKAAYQAHARRFARLGLACLIAETVQLGEVTGFHHGCYREGWFHWTSRGYSPAAIELYNGIRGLDLLAQRADVDPDRMGVTGISGGGAATWWIAAGDERVKAAAPACGTATLESHVYDRVIDGHCDCMWWPNSRQWDLADVGGLIVPRPLLIASADRDGIFPIQSIRKVHSQLSRLYGMLGKNDLLKLVETPGGHSYHEKSRTAIFSWFLKHLAGKDVPPERVGDIDTTQDQPETPETLRVFVNGTPPGNRTATIHDELIKLAAPPSIANRADLQRERKRVTDALSAHTFAAFPSAPPPLDVLEEFSRDGGTGSRFAFTSEAGWRLHGMKMTPPDPPRPLPALVVLRMPGEERDSAEKFSGRISGTLVRIIVEPRGTGETAWGEELSWHLRRAAAWTGRTLASMRVWDTLRSLQAARDLKGVDLAQISLAAKGEIAAIALYAALLDGKVKTLFLDSPPATQNAPSRPDGRGPAIEMLHCLRFTDLPQVAGLLHPTEVVLAGEIPNNYDWAESVCRKVGAAFQRVPSLDAWKPAA
jgi:cephalosporin-C deacetylase-like acetyl esterase